MGPEWGRHGNNRIGLSFYIDPASGSVYDALSA